jgi:hypothetical protein
MEPIKIIQISEKFVTSKGQSHMGTKITYLPATCRATASKSDKPSASKTHVRNFAYALQIL